MLRDHAARIILLRVVEEFREGRVATRLPYFHYFQVAIAFTRFLSSFFLQRGLLARGRFSVGSL